MQDQGQEERKHTGAKHMRGCHERTKSPIGSTLQGPDSIWCFRNVYSDGRLANSFGVFGDFDFCQAKKAGKDK